MHKITKGLKKKKKGKKSKHKEEELFKPEELEAYRREHQESGTSSGQNEEWKKFIQLTSGVDDILKKTQGDLDRIKSTSFFQRVPPPSQVKEAAEAEEEKAKEAEQQVVEENKQTAETNLGIVQVSESESEEEEDDDIFDTAYIDEVKLAYIPESPSEETTGDDPFDTSIAERAILGPAVERKGKKLVPIGAAVEVLTGRVQIPTCATPRPSSNRRQVLKEKNLLLGSFDDNANSIQTNQETGSEEVPKTLLDEDPPTPLSEPIDLGKTLHQIVIPDEDDEEFAKLAAESLAKSPVSVVAVPSDQVVVPEENWAAFSEEKAESPKDPFDTSFAENILPGKAELKIIENEILNESNDLDFDPRAEDKLSQIINKVSIKVTDPAGQRESISSLDRVSETDLNLITPTHRDLLGGSNTDLSNLNEQPLRPCEQTPSADYIEYCDPFDTSIVETVQLPGQTELKFLEKELLGDLEDEFDPRAGEPKERTISRPDVLNIGSKTVSFDLPSPQNELLEVREKIAKPLTPFYVRKNSVPEEFFPEDDPFDTSFVSEIKPGKAELKLIESELEQLEENFDFDPRKEEQKIVQVVKEPVDLLAVEHQVPAKVLTPLEEKTEISYTDPFDTSIVNICPGKTELKLLESELIESGQTPVDLLDNFPDVASHTCLKPENFDSDPFDTSIANNIAPGKTELKLLESELI